MSTVKNAKNLYLVVLHGIVSQAADETNRKLKVYAVEKNPNAVVTLHVSHAISLFLFCCYVCPFTISARVV